MSKIVELKTAEIETVTGGAGSAAAVSVNSKQEALRETLNASTQAPPASWQTSNSAFAARRY
jgi:hypothetical protein